MISLSLPLDFHWTEYYKFLLTTYIFGRIVYICIVYALIRNEFVGFALWIILQIVYHFSEFIFVCNYHIKILAWKSKNNSKKNIYIIITWIFSFIHWNEKKIPWIFFYIVFAGFLINHSSAYTIAFFLAVLEYFIEINIEKLKIKVKDNKKLRIWRIKVPYSTITFIKKIRYFFLLLL